MNPVILSLREWIAEREKRKICGLLLTGDTYAKREAIKLAGGMWDQVEKGFYMPNVQSILAVGGVPVGDHWEIPKKPKKEKTNDTNNP